LTYAVSTFIAVRVTVEPAAVVPPEAVDAVKVDAAEKSAAALLLIRTGNGRNHPAKTVLKT
jgi:hypothetical protein